MTHHQEFRTLLNLPTIKILAVLLLILCFNVSLVADEKPNIVVILADDLGYGDVQPNNPDSKIPTPTFARLAKEGVNFVDAHSGSGVCTPTRYGLVCGRYCWRTYLKKGVLGGYSKPLIAKDQQTIGHVLKGSNYHTCCIGKWHLGLGWQWNSELPSNINNFGIAGQQGAVDYSKPIDDGPTHHGFDTSYIIPASLDMSPYVFIKDDRVTEIPGKTIDGVKFPKFFRKGEISPDFTHVDCLGHLADKACAYIESRSKTDQPFFLYFPMPAPHKPVIPTPEFQGKTKLGPYGDFVAQVDDIVGRVMQAIDDAGIADNTLLIVTSDNGSFMHRYDSSEEKDHVDNESIQGFRSENHTSNGLLRGTKADVYEAGHRVPFFCRWPGKIPAASESTNTICLTDILATAADAAQCEFDKAKSEDTFSFLAAAMGESKSSRPPVINHSSGGTFAIRDGNWKLILGSGSGGRQKPRGKAFEQPYQLYDLSEDIGETNNVLNEHRGIESKLLKDFETVAYGDQKFKNKK